MKTSDLKNKNVLETFIYNEPSVRVLKFLFIHFLQNNTFKDKSYFKSSLQSIKNTHKTNLKSHISSRCLLTNRSRSLHKRFGLSRIILRDMLKRGVLPGYKKAVW